MKLATFFVFASQVKSNILVFTAIKEVNMCKLHSAIYLFCQESL